MFNSFFTKQCSVIENGGEILIVVHPKTTYSLWNTTFSEEHIEKVMQNLASNKACGHNISICILKVCGKYIAKPWEGLVLRLAEKSQQMFLSIKNNKQLLKNYRPKYLTTQCMCFSSKISWSHQIGPISRQVALASNNLFLSILKYANHLMMTVK